MSLLVRSAGAHHELVWNDDVIAVIESVGAADELREALWLLKSLAPVATFAIKSFGDMLEIKGPTPTEKQFVVDSNFLLELIAKYRARDKKFH